MLLLSQLIETVTRVCDPLDKPRIEYTTIYQMLNNTFKIGGILGKSVAESILIQVGLFYL